MDWDQKTMGNNVIDDVVSAKGDHGWNSRGRRKQNDQQPRIATKGKATKQATEAVYNFRIARDPTMSLVARWECVKAFPTKYSAG